MPKHGVGRATNLALDVALLALALLHLWASPFTKVEESFNVQGAHDLVFLGSDTDAYDHLAFPGVVPRTAWGPVALAAAAAPGAALRRLVGGGEGDAQRAALFCARAGLAALSVASLGALRRAAGRRFGDPRVAVGAGVVALAQFHLPFYASRPLANVFASAATNMAVAALLDGGGREGPATAWFALATAVFRCDCVLLAGPALVLALFGGRARLGRVLVWGLAASPLLVGAAFAADSLFWRRPVWAEWEVLAFNTFRSGMRGSEAWGTSPWHWYATSALPRALLGAAALLPFGVLAAAPTPERLRRARLADLLRPRREALEVLAPAAAFVALYSFLPHKELRFVFPALPLLNVVAGAGLVRLWEVRGKARLMWLCAVAGLAASTAAAAGFGHVSSLNYPGGRALEALAAMDPQPQQQQGDALPLVHVCNLAAISGASRFGERRDLYRYSKREGIDGGGFDELCEFDLLVNEREHVPGFEAVAAVDGLKSVSLRSLRVEVGPVLHIHRRVGDGCAV